MYIEKELLISDLPQECIDECSAMGQVDDAVEYWVDQLELTFNRHNAECYLQGFGAWEESELGAMDNREIAMKVLWLACGQFSDYQICGADCASDVVMLEH